MGRGTPVSKQAASKNRGTPARKQAATMGRGTPVDKQTAAMGRGTPVGKKTAAVGRGPLVDKQAVVMGRGTPEGKQGPTMGRGMPVGKHAETLGRGATVAMQVATMGRGTPVSKQVTTVGRWTHVSKKVTTLAVEMDQMTLQSKQTTTQAGKMGRTKVEIKQATTLATTVSVKMSGTSACKTGVTRGRETSLGLNNVFHGSIAQSNVKHSNSKEIHTFLKAQKKKILDDHKNDSRSLHPVYTRPPVASGMSTSAGGRVSNAKRNLHTIGAAYQPKKHVSYGTHYPVGNHASHSTQYQVPYHDSRSTQYPVPYHDSCNTKYSVPYLKNSEIETGNANLMTSDFGSYVSTNQLNMQSSNDFSIIHANRNPISTRKDERGVASPTSENPEENTLSSYGSVNGYYNPKEKIDHGQSGGPKDMKNKSRISPQNLSENHIQSGSECAIQKTACSFPVYVKVHGDQDGAYKNEGEPRGLILIKNITTFDDPDFKRRDGSDKDFTDLRTLFHQMGYAEGGGLCESGYIKLRSLRDDLITFSQLDHQKHDSAIIVIMSHGIDDSTFVTSDGFEMKVSTVQNISNNSNCPNLRGKPKVLILHFCRPEIFVKSSTWIIDDIQLNSEMRSKSEQILNSSQIKSRKNRVEFDLPEILPSHERNKRINQLYENSANGELESQGYQFHRSKLEVKRDSPELLHDARTDPERITRADSLPVISDMITIFSNTSGGLAYRHPRNGSLMIQSLCQIFSLHAHCDHIEELLKKVSQQMEQETEKFRGFDVGNESAVVEWHCNLKKLFYFNPHTVQDHSPKSLTTKYTNT